MLNINELMEAADDIRGALPVIARLMRSYYIQLVEAGFGRAEALKIVIAHGMHAGGIGGK